MSKVTGLSFETIENPYDNNLNRTDAETINQVGTVDLGPAGDSDDYINRELSGEDPKEEKSIQGQDLENLWINSWIKSRSYLPGKRGFLIDGKTGFIECARLKVRGTGEIGGWNIDATRIYSDDDGLILDSSVPKIESGNYISGYAGAGVHLSPDLLEVGNIACRGIFRSAVLQYDNTFAYGGNQIIAKGADVLKITMTAADDSTVEIENDSEASSWAIGDILKLDDANDLEWLEITSSSGNIYTCTRDKKGDYGAGENPTWEAGAAVVNHGQSGDGWIYLTASEINAPYFSIFTTEGNPWTDSVERLRIGNQKGFLSEGSEVYGMGIGDATHYLKYDPTNHLRIRGNITASTITGGTFKTSDSGKRIVLAGSDNTLRFYDATAESLNIGTSGGQAISITGNATTSRGVVMSSAVAGVGFKYTNTNDVQCVGLDLAMGAGLALSNSLPSIRIKMGGTGEILWGDISNTGKGVYITRSVGAGTSNLLKLSSTNLTAGTMADIFRSGSGIITALNIDHATSSNSVNTGIIMSLSSNQANLCRAFRFNGSEIVATAVGGSQNKKLRVNVAGTDYYIPLHTA